MAAPRARAASNAFAGQCPRALLRLVVERPLERLERGTHLIEQRVDGAHSVAARAPSSRCRGERGDAQDATADVFLVTRCARRCESLFEALSASSSR